MRQVSDTSNGHFHARPQQFAPIPGSELRSGGPASRAAKRAAEPTAMDQRAAELEKTAHVSTIVPVHIVRRASEERVRAKRTGGSGSLT